MVDLPLLTLITFLPLIGAVAMVFMRGADDDLAAAQGAKSFALLVTTATFVASLFVLAGFDPSADGYQFVEQDPWIAGLTYKLGVDGISILFVMLTTALMPITILASWGIKTRVRDYMAAFLVLETMMIKIYHPQS